jgi:hypothetical protein
MDVEDPKSIRQHGWKCKLVMYDLDKSGSGKQEIMLNDFSKSIKGYKNPVRIEDNQEQQREM